MKPEHEKIAHFIKVTDELIKGRDGDDFIKEMITCAMYGHVLIASKEQGEIEVFVRRPSFLDWLFRRSKTIKRSYEIRQLMKHPPIPDALPIIQFGDQRIEDESSAIDPLIL